MSLLATVTSREVFVPHTEPGCAVHAASYQVGPDGQLLSVHGYETRSDTIDDAFLRRSSDNGATWGPEVNWPTEFAAEGGTGRRHHRGCYLDPATGRVLMLWSEGVLPGDDPLEGMWRWTLHSVVSHDSGATFPINEQIIQTGEGYDAIHHLPGITVGQNCAMMGDLGERPLTRSDGVIVVPVQISRVGPDGRYHNPGAGFTFLDSLMLFGRWRADGRLDWTTSAPIVSDPALSTRGLFEPTIAELPDGRLICLMRGSNDRKPDLPGRRWHAVSEDGGTTWSTPVPWTFVDGTDFHSPSSCSQLLAWPDGRLFWLGNLCGENPRGNSPRYPFVIGQVDLATGLLRRDSLVTLDDRAPHESPKLTLSNFYARRDAVTGELLLHLTRLFADAEANRETIDWTADAMLTRVAIHP